MMIKMTNRIGKVFSITTFGSSHGKAIGAIIDGCPANLELSVRDIQKELDKKSLEIIVFQPLEKNLIK